MAVDQYANGFGDLITTGMTQSYKSVATVSS